MSPKPASGAPDRTRCPKCKKQKFKESVKRVQEKTLTTRVCKGCGNRWSFVESQSFKG